MNNAQLKVFRFINIDVHTITCCYKQVSYRLVGHSHTWYTLRSQQLSHARGDTPLSHDAECKHAVATQLPLKTDIMMSRDDQGDG